MSNQEKFLALMWAEAIT